MQGGAAGPNNGIMAAVIRTEGMTKAYGTLLALDQLSLTVEPGEVLGFLGPNGAGKSTTIRLLLDLIRPTAGHAEVLGFDCRRQSHEVRARTGYLPGDLRLYGKLTGRETASLFARLKGLHDGDDEAERLAARLDLDLDRHIGMLSKGNRQKVGILVALLGRPPLLVLDEPTSGLDPLMQHTVWGLLRDAAAEGRTVFFSSHVMGEVEQVCRRVAILRAGKLVAVDPVAELKGRGLRRVEVSFAGATPTEADHAIPGVEELRRNGQTVEYAVTGEVDPLIKALAPYHVIDLRTEQPSLDEVLMAYYREAK